MSHDTDMPLLGTESSGTTSGVPHHQHTLPEGVDELLWQSLMHGMAEEEQGVFQDFLGALQTPEEEGEEQEDSLRVFPDSLLPRGGGACPRALTLSSQCE